MSVESLKRVLLGIKGEARGMRKSKLERRLNPEPEAVTPEEVTPLDAPEESVTEDGSPTTEPDAEETDAETTIEEIRKLLAQV